LKRKLKPQTKIMKKQILLASGAFLLASVLFVGCKKDDTTNPEITLKGDAAQTVVLNAALTDPGATANDDRDGDLTANITSDYMSKVNKDQTGTYTVTYTVTDEAGNTGTTTRTVTVKNDADKYAGTYTVTENCTGSSGPYTYSQTITSSPTINNRVVFSKFGDYSNNTAIYGNITGTTIDVPNQTAIGVGSPAADRNFQGSATNISTSGFTLNYVETTNGTSTGCSASFVK
jgi:hypothetical protein